LFIRVLHISEISRAQTQKIIVAVKLKNNHTTIVEVQTNKYMKQSVDQEGWLRRATESRKLGEATVLATITVNVQHHLHAVT